MLNVMAPLSFIGPIKSNAITSFQPPLFPLNNCYYSCRHNSISLARKLPRNVHHVHGNSASPFSHQSFLHRSLLYYERQRGGGGGGGASFIAFDANKNSSESAGGEEEDNNEALDAVMKLYSAFKNKITHELSEIHAYECRHVCNFLSLFQELQGKTQVLEFFTNLIKILGKNIKIVVKPTLHDGMNVDVQWQFVWEKIHIPLWMGFSFCIHQSCYGKAEFEMFMEPLHYLVPFRLKMKASLAELVEKIGSLRVAKSGKKVKWILCIVLAVLSLAALMLFFRKLS